MDQLKQVKGQIHHVVEQKDTEPIIGEVDTNLQPHALDLSDGEIEPDDSSFKEKKYNSSAREINWNSFVQKFPSKIYDSIDYSQKEDTVTFEDTNPFENIFEGGDDEQLGDQNSNLQSNEPTFKQRFFKNHGSKINDKKMKIQQMINQEKIASHPKLTKNFKTTMESNNRRETMSKNTNTAVSKTALTTEENLENRGINFIEEQYFKKQMEFKAGKMHQLVTDQLVNTNMIFANRYQGFLGFWYFIIDSTLHFENCLSALLLIIILHDEFDMLHASYPIIAFSINVFLMSIRNVVFELRQRNVTDKINNKVVDFLFITRKLKRFVPIHWGECLPGYIIRVKSGQEFPADCLILDIAGGQGQKCYITSGPFDTTTNIIQKKSYSATSNKSGSKNQNHEQHMSDLISGILKFEYNYYGYIQGSFKLNENPAAIDFDQDNVVQRGALLTHTPQVTCLVLNVGDQCMGSVYKDPNTAMDSNTSQKLKTFIKTQRSFDKAYKQSIRAFLLSLAIIYWAISFLSIYLASTGRFFNVAAFEFNLVKNFSINFNFYIKKGVGFFSILLSSIPLSFSNIIDLLVLMHTNFAEWDVNITPADIDFIQPHATLAFGKVAHMFFSRRALQRDDKQSIKLFHVGNHFYKNQTLQFWDKQNVDSSQKSFSDNENSNTNPEKDDNSQIDELSLDYLPNEQKHTKNFFNNETDQILNGPDCRTKEMIVEFFRGITLCHQINVNKDVRQSQSNMYQYVGVFNDEIASLDFANQQNFKLVQRSKKMLSVILQGKSERYEELGVVTTKAVMGHFMTISAMRLHGNQAGILYMKGSIASLKHYFVNKESDFQYLNLFEQKFITSGLHAVVYAKRQLTIEETQNLIITINEGIQQTKENSKLENMLYNLTSVQLEILGVLGVSRAVHFRNRVAVDDMILNGVKPWIVSKEDEQTHMTCLNSMRLFQNCAQPILINGTHEKVVTDQITSALKLITDRMATRTQTGAQGEDLYEEKDKSLKSHSASNTAYTKPGSKGPAPSTKSQNDRADLLELRDRGAKKNHNQNAIIFTGVALQEISRDITMQKAFMTLAYISDLMVGSEISPLQKQKLVKMAKSYVGEGEYAAAIVTTPEDQFMVNEADLCANLKVKGKSTDFQAVVDVTFKDFSAVSYLLFKHGNQIQMRISKAAQAFYYRSLLTFLILTTYMVRSGFSGQMPFTNGYYYTFMLFIAPLEILIYSTFYKDVGYEYLYRIYGHYKYNFSFSLVESKSIIIDTASALFDWGVVYLPHELAAFGYPISVINGKNISVGTYNCYQVILSQIIFFYYFKNTNVQVIQSISCIVILTLIGCIMIFDEGMQGVKMFFYTPALMLTLLWQLLVLSSRNAFIDVMSKLVIRRFADLHDWYADIEDRLSYEEYEDPNQSFSIQQYGPLFAQINSSNIQNTLKLINTNMMKVPKNDTLGQILDKINSELGMDRRSLDYGGYSNLGQNIDSRTVGSPEAHAFGVNHMIEGTQMALNSGSINRWTLTLNDMNQETEYQENKNFREIIYVRRQMLVFILTTVVFSIFGLILTLSIDFTNIGIYYYLGLSLLTFLIYSVLPKVTVYVSNVLLFYTVVVIFCYTIYTSNDMSLQPTGLIMVLALVAGLNHSFIYPTVCMILASVLMHVFFSFLGEFEGGQSNFNNSYRVALWIVVSLTWSVYVYMQELEKKTSFVSGHKKVRNFQKLKQILNILVPSLVRDKIRSGKKNFSDEEGEVTIIFIDIHQFDAIVESYKGLELLNLLDAVYNAFDQMCDQYGLQKVETVGKTYMACGGLKSAERKIESRLLNRHHSVRVTDFGLEAISYVKNIFLKDGKHLQVKIGIHTGAVISGVVGDTKPQFSLIGDTVNKSSRVCSLTKPLKCTVSKQTQRYLEVYTNNLQFEESEVQMKGIGTEPIFAVSAKRGGRIANQGQPPARLPGGGAHTGPFSQQSPATAKKNSEDKGEDGTPSNVEGYQRNLINDSESLGSGSLQSHRGQDSRRGLVDEQNVAFDLENSNLQQFDNESNNSGLIDDGTMNVFGFNDDLNLDDRIIVQNATDNQIYNVVERPKYLLQFEQRDLEQDFLYQISKAEARKTTLFLAMLIMLNKVAICGDILQDDQDFQFTPQFFCMFPIFIFELTLIYKLNNPQLEYVHIWTYLLLLYGIVVLFVLMSFQVKYLGFWTRAGFNELQIQLSLSMFFFMRNVMLRHFLMTYSIYFACWILTLCFLAERFEYQIVQFILGQIMYAILLAVGIHHREMIQRKSLNYERILNVEINKTNELISKLVPYHMLNVIKNEKRQVDEFTDCTLLFTDMVKFTAFSKNAKDPREVVNLLSKLFSRFDQLCDQYRVYKVHTIGDCYVIMGYNGRIEKAKRTLTNVIEEAHRVLLAGLEMIDIIGEVRNASENQDLKDLDMRIGIHTGRVVAGIIGSKVVRYDIFGDGVLIANKMESNGVPGKVCISEDTRKLINRSPELSREFVFEPHNAVTLASINRRIDTYVVDRRSESCLSKSDSEEDSEGSSGDYGEQQGADESSESSDGETKRKLKSTSKDSQELPGRRREKRKRAQVGPEQADAPKAGTTRGRKKGGARANAGTGKSSYDQTQDSHSKSSQLRSLDRKGRKEQQEPLTAMDESILAEAKETWLTNLIVRRPCEVFSITLLFMLIFTLIAFGSGLFELDEFSARDNYVWSSPVVHDHEKQYAAELFFGENKIGQPGQGVAARSREVGEWTACLLYMNHASANAYGALEKQSLLKQQALEQAMRDDPLYGQVCLATSETDPACSPAGFLSALDLFAGYDLGALSQEDILRVLREAAGNAELWSIYETLFDEGFAGLEGQEPSLELPATHVRTMISFGAPIEAKKKRYASLYDRREEQEERVYEYQRKFLEVIADIQKQRDPEFLPSLWSALLAGGYVRPQLREDAKLAAGAFGSTLVIMAVHFRSAFLACAAAATMLLSFPVTRVLCRALFGLTPFGQLHVLTLFLVLGVSSACYFVLYEAWVESLQFHFLRDSKRRRMAFALRKTHRVAAVGVLVAFAALFTNVFSPLVGIRSFGIFSSFLMLINYALIFAMFAPLLVCYDETVAPQSIALWRQYVRHPCSRLFSRARKRLFPQAEDELEQTHDAASVMDQSSVQAAHQPSNLLQEFYVLKWNRFVSGFQWVILFFSLVWAIVVVINAALIMPLQREEKQFVPAHQLAMGAFCLSDRFLRGDAAFFDIDIYFGVKDVNLSDSNAWERAREIGTPEFDEDFDGLRATESQDFLLEVCEGLGQQEFVSKAEPVTCWIQNYTAWLESNGYGREQFIEKLDEWVSGTPEGKDALYKNEIGFKDGKVVYTKISAKSEKILELSDVNVRQNSQKAESDTRFSQWSGFVSQKRSEAPASMKSMTQSSPEWATFVTNGAFYRTLAQNTLLMFPLVTLILLWHTRSYIMTAIMFCALNLITSSIVAIMKFSAWRVGTAEAVGVPIVIAITVYSYSYLASYYMHAPREMNRGLRMQYAYQEMGVSVTSGLIVTFFTGAWLLFAKVLLLQKVGVIMLASSLYAFYGSMIAFGVVCHICGPQGDIVTVPVHLVEEWLAEQWSSISKVWSEKVAPPLLSLQSRIADLLEAPRKSSPTNAQAEEEQSPAQTEEYQSKDQQKVSSRRREQRKREARGDTAVGQAQNQVILPVNNNPNQEPRDDVSDIGYKMKPRKKGKRTRPRDVPIQEFEKSALN